MQALIHGILIGLTITISIGPACLAILQTSIVRGVKYGFIVATGVLISDLLLIGLCYLGLSKIIPPGHSIAMLIISGTIMIIAGVASLLHKSNIKIARENDSKKNQKKVFSFMTKGFLVNITNPFVLIFWLGLMSFAVSNYGFHSNKFFIFFSAVLFTGFSSDLIKCRLSGLLKKILNAKSIATLNKGIGLVFITIGILFIARIFK